MLKTVIFLASMSSILTAIDNTRDFIFIAIAIAIISIIVCALVSKFNVSMPFSNVKFERYGNRSYGLVNEKDRENVLKLFKQITERVDKFVAHCVNTSFPDKDRAQRLHSRWTKVRIRETDPNESSIAYIVNKDYELRVCVTDKVNRNAEQLNTAMFVVIHELAHMASVSFGHNEEFWSNFKILLGEAIKVGIYEYQDYSRETEKYCGIKIYSTPCSDSSCS